MTADLPASPAELPPTRMRYIRIASTPHSFIASNGLATFPRLLLILNRSIVQWPCVKMCFGRGKSSARRIAGRYRAWKLFSKGVAVSAFSTATDITKS